MAAAFIFRILALQEERGEGKVKQVGSMYSGLMSLRKFLAGFFASVIINWYGVLT